MVASVGAASDPCAIRAALPVVTSTTSPSPAPARSIATKGAWDCSASRPSSKGETSSSLKELRPGALIVETTLPTTLPSSMALAPGFVLAPKSANCCDDRVDLVFRSFDRRDNSCAPVLSRAAMARGLPSVDDCALFAKAAQKRCLTREREERSHDSRRGRALPRAGSRRAHMGRDEFLRLLQ